MNLSDYFFIPDEILLRGNFWNECRKCGCLVRQRMTRMHATQHEEIQILLDMVKNGRIFPDDSYSHFS